MPFVQWVCRRIYCGLQTTIHSYQNPSQWSCRGSMVSLCSSDVSLSPECSSNNHALRSYGIRHVVYLEHLFPCLRSPREPPTSVCCTRVTIQTVYRQVKLHRIVHNNSTQASNLNHADLCMSISNSQQRDLPVVGTTHSSEKQATTTFHYFESVKTTP